MSTTIHYTLTPISRISAGRAGEVQNSRPIHEVLPGTVIWGALGTSWWLPDGGFDHSDPGHEQADFDRTFHSGIEVGPAIPRLVPADGPSTGDLPAAEFRPLSWVRCKYPTGAQCSGDWHDQMTDVPADVTDELTAHCPGCQRPWEYARGWEIPTEFSTAITRTALTRGVAADSQLFTRRALRSASARNGTPLILEGTIRLARDAPDTVTEWLTKRRQLRLGGQRSTMGHCTWTAEVQQTPTGPPISASASMAVRLVSPAILVDRFGAASLDLTSALQTAIDTSGGSGTVIRQWVRPEVVSGWHGLAGLPKPEEWGLAAGSCALVRKVDNSSLEAIMAGVGLRRAEGYGRVVVVPLERANRLIDPNRLTPVDLGVEDEPPSAVQGRGRDRAGTPAPSTSVEQLLRSLLGNPLWNATLKGLRDAAAAVHRLQSRAFPDHVVRSRIETIKTLPWMRDLPADLQDQVVRVLTDREHLHVAIARIDEELKPDGR